MRPTFSRWNGGLRVGANFFERRGACAKVVEAGQEPRGLVDRVTDLVDDARAVEGVAPEVVAFFERTAELDLRIRSRWRLPFFVLWVLARPLFLLAGQLVLPVARGRIRTRVFALAEGRDGRPGARAVVRTYVPSGRVMQVVAYALERRGGGPTMSVAFPWPCGQLLGLLRLERAGARGLALTSRAEGAGIWWRVFGLAVRVPLAERLELQPASTPGADDFADATLEGTHEQRLFGVLVVRHHYSFQPRPEAF